MTSLTNPASVIVCSYVPAASPRSGEQVRVNALWRAFAALGLKVHAFVPQETGLIPDELRQRNIEFHSVDIPWPQLSRNPWDYWRVNSDLVSQIGVLSEKEKPSAIIFDYGFLGQYIGPCRRFGIPIIMGTHNAQAQLTRLVPPRSAAHRVFLRLAHAMERWHEIKYFPTADALLCVSEQDRAYHAEFVSLERVHIVPNFIEEPSGYADLARQNRIIMTASFTNFQNLEGARWFLTEVWNTELATATSLCLAGRGSVEALKSIGSFPNVIALGEQPDLYREVATSICAIAPILHASGTRLKCIEALALHTPLLSTSRGAEGLEHEDNIVIADTPQEFRTQLLRIVSDVNYRTRLALGGYRLFVEKYSMTGNIKHLRCLLSSLNGHDKTSS